MNTEELNSTHKKLIKLLYLTGPGYLSQDKIKLIRQGYRWKYFFDFAMTELNKYSIDVDYLELKSWNSLISRLAQTLKVLASRKKYDLVLTSTGTGLLLGLSRFLYPWKKPYICKISWQVDYTGKYKLIFDKFLKTVLRTYVNSIICVASSQIKSFSRSLGISQKRIKFIPLGIDTEFFRPEEMPFSLNSIICVGDADRDEFTLVKSVINLPVMLVRVSDEPRITEIFKRMSGEHNCLDNVRVLKGLSDVELKRLYSQSTLAVVSVRYDSRQPAGLTALLEAMAMGKTVIVTKGLNSEDYVINGETGIVVEPENPLEMKKAIIQVLNDDSMRNMIGKNACHFVQENCSIAGNAEKLAKCLRDIVNENSESV